MPASSEISRPKLSARRPAPTSRYRRHCGLEGDQDALNPDTPVAQWRAPPAFVPKQREWPIALCRPRSLPSDASFSFNAVAGKGNGLPDWFV